jgi:Flp pilus assembly pilin Flp
MSSIENKTPSTPKSVRKPSWFARFMRDERGLTTMEILALIAGLIVMVTMAAPVLQEGATTGANGVVKRLTDWTGGGQ